MADPPTDVLLKHPPDASTDVQRPTFVAMVTSKDSTVTPHFQPVPLASRALSYIGKTPAVLFTPLEVDQLNKQVENTLIMKFAGGRPSLLEIRSHIESEWRLESAPAIGLLDPRHITIHMGSESDLKRALSRNSHSIKNCMFRLFRWTPEFQMGKDSCMAPVWVRFPKLPLQYFNLAALERIGSSLGTVLRVDDRTLSFTHNMYGRVCIEMDVSQPFLEQIWIGITKEQGWWQRVEYEGNNAFCSVFGLLGHTAGFCRKNCWKLIS